LFLALVAWVIPKVFRFLTRIFRRAPASESTTLPIGEPGKRVSVDAASGRA
jgi:hypothetical protein